MPSPNCFINGLTPPQVVSSGATITIALISTQGVGPWAVTVIGSDETLDDTVLNGLITYVTPYSATLAIPAGTGKSITFQSIINNAVDNNNVFHPEWITTFQVNVPALTGNIVGCQNETTEFSSKGWTGKFNAPLRSGFTFPTGPATGDLSGTYPSPTVSGIQNIPVSSTTPTVGQVLEFNSGQWAPSNATNIFTAGGDLTGNSTNQTVVSISGPSPITINSAALQFAPNLIASVGQAAEGTNSSIGNTLSINAQNKTGTNTTGAALGLFAGSGTSTNGKILLGVNGTTGITVTPSSLGASSITVVSGATSVAIGQSDTSSANGASLTVSAQNTTFGGATGGSLNLTSGNGATVGNVNINVGPTGVLHTSGTNQFVFFASVSNALFGQSTVSSDVAPGNLTVQASYGFAGGTHNGGNLILTSGGAGAGSSGIAGNVNLQAGGTTRVSISPSTTTFTGGIQRQIRSIINSLTVDSGGVIDDIIFVNASGVLNITLPNPATNNGRCITIRDAVGTFGSQTVTLVRHGSENINAVAANRQLSSNFGEYLVICDGTNWHTFGNNKASLAFTASSTNWTAPSGVTLIDVVGCGGGGGGGYGLNGPGNAPGATPSPGGGGGGGALLGMASVSVTPNTTYVMAVGAGGTGSTGVPTNGNPGGDSSISTGGNSLVKFFGASGALGATTVLIDGYAGQGYKGPAGVNLYASNPGLGMHSPSIANGGNSGNNTQNTVTQPGSNQTTGLGAANVGGTAGANGTTNAGYNYGIGGGGGGAGGFGPGGAGGQGGNGNASGSSQGNPGSNAPANSGGGGGGGGGGAGDSHGFGSAGGGGNGAMGQIVIYWND